MPPSPPAVFTLLFPSGTEGTATLVVCLALAARVAGLIAVSGQWLYPGLTPQLRLGLSVVLAAATAPAAVVALQQDGGGPMPPLPLLVGSELLVGAGLGLAVAILVSAVAGAGGLLATVTGLDWAASFTPGGGDGPGVARLCGWLGLAAFVSAGGQRLVMGGFYDSCWRLPVGRLATALGGTDLPLPAVLVQLPAAGLSLALALALPVLVAVITTHVAAAICLRTVSLTPGPGLLQGVASVVLLLSLLVGSRQWAEQAGQLLLPPVAASFEAAEQTTQHGEVPR